MLWRLLAGLAVVAAAAGRLAAEPIRAVYDPRRPPCVNPNLADFTAQPPKRDPFCGRAQALRLVPLIYNQFLAVINAGNYQQVPGLLAEDSLYTGNLAEDYFCQRSAGEIPQLLAYFQGALWTSRIVDVLYDPRDGSVTVDSVLMQEAGRQVTRVFRSSMQFTAEVACSYRLAYWGLVEFSCADAPACGCK